MKERLFKAKILKNECLICGQRNEWRGNPMTLIMDHINGIHNDNRLKNLRIVCSNCNSTLDTNCGLNTKKNIKPEKKACSRCKKKFQPSQKNRNRKYCSRECHWPTKTKTEKSEQQVVTHKNTQQRVFKKEDLEKAVAKSMTYADTVRILGLDSSTTNRRHVTNHIELFNIDISHFDPYRSGGRTVGGVKQKTFNQILVKNSTYSRFALKKRLIEAKMIKNECGICGQLDNWKGTKITLILDHINGKNNDNRLINLRLICPNCNSTLDTYCGRNKKKPMPKIKQCFGCKKDFQTAPGRRQIKYCSKECLRKVRISPRYKQRKVIRPSCETLLVETKNNGFSATGRKYGVSDNAVRKWIKAYKKEI